MPPAPTVAAVRRMLDALGTQWPGESERMLVAQAPRLPVSLVRRLARQPELAVAYAGSDGVDERGAEALLDDWAPAALGYPRLERMRGDGDARAACDTGRTGEEIWSQLATRGRIAPDSPWVARAMRLGRRLGHTLQRQEAAERAKGADGQGAEAGERGWSGRRTVPAPRWQVDSWRSRMAEVGWLLGHCSRLGERALGEILDWVPPRRWPEQWMLLVKAGGAGAELWGRMLGAVASMEAGEGRERLWTELIVGLADDPRSRGWAPLQHLAFGETDLLAPEQQVVLGQFWIADGGELAGRALERLAERDPRLLTRELADLSPAAAARIPLAAWRSAVERVAGHPGGVEEVVVAAAPVGVWTLFSPRERAALSVRGGPALRVAIARRLGEGGGRGGRG